MRAWVCVLAVVLGAGCWGRHSGKADRPFSDSVTRAPLGAEPIPQSELPGREWIEAVHARFHERWALQFLEHLRKYVELSSPLNKRRLATKLWITMAADGSVRKIEVAESSGNLAFDAASIQVAGESGPLTAPPGELRSDDGNFYAEWLFARDSRQCGVAGARLVRIEWEATRAIPELLNAGRLPDAAARLADALSSTTPPSGSTATTLLSLGREIAGAALEVALADVSSPAGQTEAARVARVTMRLPALAQLRALAISAPDLSLQREALLSLGVLGDRSALPLIVETAKRMDGERSAAAVAALVQLGERKTAWRFIEPHLASSDPHERESALQTMIDLGEPASVVSLAAVLDPHNPRAHRVAAARAFGSILQNDAAAAQKPLLRGMSDGDAAVRSASVQAVVRAARAGFRAKTLAPKLASLLSDRDPDVRSEVVTAFALLGPGGVGGDILGLVRREKDAGVLAACAVALADFPGGAALSMLREFSRSPVSEVRTAAVSSLVHRSEQEAQDEVAALSSDLDAAVRALAVRAQTSQNGILSALVDPSPEVRAAAVLRLPYMFGPLEAASHWARVFANAGAQRDRVLLAEAWLMSAKEADAQ